MISCSIILPTGSKKSRWKRYTMWHFFATYLLEHGTSKQVAADLLGHADTAFLERTYCHPQDVCKEEAAGLFDSLLAPAEEEYCDALQD